MQLYNLGNDFYNQYVLRTTKGLLVLDTGYPGGFAVYQRKLQSAGLSLGDVSYIFLTHAHDDHAGFLQELAQQTQARIILHQKAVQRLKRGSNGSHGRFDHVGALMLSKGLGWIGRNGCFPPVDLPSRYLVYGCGQEKLEVEGLEGMIVLLPGHTEDSIGLLLADGRLFCGDAAMNGLPSIRHRSIWIEDEEEYLRSWRKIVDAQPKRIYPSHGRPFPVNELVKYIK